VELLLVVSEVRGELAVVDHGTGHEGLLPPRDLPDIGGVSLVDFAVAGVLLVGFMVYCRIPIAWPVVCLPLLILIQIAFTIAGG